MFRVFAVEVGGVSIRLASISNRARKAAGNFSESVSSAMSEDMNVNQTQSQSDSSSSVLSNSTRNNSGSTADQFSTVGEE